MKVAPVWSALAAEPRISQVLVHTGQHYDANMSQVFFSDLGLPTPEVNLEVGSASHARQTADVMVRFERVVLDRKPDLVLVYGDVNSTLACALVCSKLLIRVGHVEAGLRSSDRRMPEEINRIVTDQICDFLFTPSDDAGVNLQQEGIAPARIHFVGNVMIDSLVRLLPIAMQRPRNGYPDRYVLVTLHRPLTVDDPSALTGIMQELITLSRHVNVIFPMHPRTKQRVSGLGIDANRLLILDPQPYIDFLALQRRAVAVVTDSGGIQEETTFLGIPCLTVRDNTERPVTATVGTNILVGQNASTLLFEMDKILNGNQKVGSVPPLWDGHTSERIVEVLRRLH